MISSIRIDDRLIHGQVALVWSKELGTDRIVVANDEAATSDVMKMTLKMATPTGIKLLVKGVDDCVKVFNDPRAHELNMFVLTSNVHCFASCKGMPRSGEVSERGERWPFRRHRRFTQDPDQSLHHFESPGACRST